MVDAAAELARLGEELADGVEARLPGWVQRAVERLLMAWSGAADPVVMAEAHAAGAQARDEIGPQVRELLALDVDQQRANPLSVLRGAVRFPTEVLRRAGVPEVVRDEFAERAFPGDVYDLVPAGFADIDPVLHEPGLAWGAAKAYVILSRRKAAGLS